MVSAIKNIAIYKKRMMINFYRLSTNRRRTIFEPVEQLDTVSLKLGHKQTTTLKHLQSGTLYSLARNEPVNTLSTQIIYQA